MLRDQLPAAHSILLWGWAGGENRAERRRKKEEQKEKEEKKMERKRERMAASL